MHTSCHCDSAAAQAILRYDTCSVEFSQCTLCLSDGRLPMHLQPLATPRHLKAVVKRAHLVSSVIPCCCPCILQNALAQCPCRMQDFICALVATPVSGRVTQSQDRIITANVISGNVTLVVMPVHWVSEEAIAICNMH